MASSLIFVWYFNDFNERPECAQIPNDWKKDLLLKKETWEDKYHPWKSGKGECCIKFIGWNVFSYVIKGHRQLFVCLLPNNRSSFNWNLLSTAEQVLGLNETSIWEAQDCNLETNDIKGKYCQINEEVILSKYQGYFVTFSS